MIFIVNTHFVFQAYLSCPLDIRMVGFAMAAYGGSTSVCTALTSQIVRCTGRPGRYALFSLAAAVIMAVLVVMYRWQPTADDTIEIFAIPVIFGLVDGIWNAQTNGNVYVVFTIQYNTMFLFRHFRA
jgi:hypothetical protein